MSNVLKMLSRGGAIPAPTDPYFNQTTLLLHGDGTNGAQNQSFIDESGNVGTITRVGNATQGTFSPYSTEEGKWSVYTGENSYINTSTSSDFTCGTGAFTIEFWLNANPTSIGYLFDLQAWSPRMTIFTEGAYLKIYDGSYRTLGTLEYGQWAHWAICRTSTTDNNIYFYKNGVYQGSFSGGAASSSSSWTWVRLGGYTTSSYSADGFLSNVRMIKNQNLMSSNPTGSFDPPTGPISATEVGWGGTNVDSSITGTVPLCCFQSNRFINNTTSSVSFATFSGTNQIQPFSPFAPSAAYDPAVNGGSIYVDGVSGDKIYFTPTNLTGQFTVQCWVYCTGVSGLSNLVPFSNWSTGMLLRFGATNGYVEFYTLAGSGSASGNQIKAGTWLHCEVTRDASNVIRVFLDGVQKISYTGAGTITMTDFCIGAEQKTTTTNDLFRGYISGFQLLNGTCLHTSNFDVPTAPPTNITNTKFLSNFTNAGIIDSTQKNNLETLTNATISTTTKEFGTGSMSFNGSGYLNLSNLSNFDFRTYDFTIEFWVRFNTVSVSQYLVDWGSGLIYLSSSGSSIRYYDGTLRITGPALSTDTWYYIALTRENKSTKLFVDGVQVGSTYTDTNSYTPTTFHVGGSTPDTNGFIDELRVTKGVARDVTVVPTAPFPDQ